MLQMTLEAPLCAICVCFTAYPSEKNLKPNGLIALEASQAINYIFIRFRAFSFSFLSLLFWNEEFVLLARLSLCSCEFAQCALVCDGFTTLMSLVQNRNERWFIATVNVCVLRICLDILCEVFMKCHYDRWRKRCVLTFTFGIFLRLKWNFKAAVYFALACVSSLVSVS